MPRDQFTPEIQAAILETLRAEIPFLALAAEKHGINRNTMWTWMHEGDHGNEKYAPFTRQVRAIRAAYLMKLTGEIMNATRETGEASRHKAWILQRLDREIFDPPQQAQEKVTEGRGRDQQKRAAPRPPDHPDVSKAADELANPEGNGPGLSH